MRLAAYFCALYAVLALTAPVRAQSAEGRRGAVATVNQIASRAGIEAMKKGGNAVDAAVASALTLGVVNGFNSGIGGGCFILIRRANGEILAIDGRETAPAAATHDLYLRKGKADPSLSQIGALASGVPGELAALDLALKNCGKLSLKEHLQAAAQIAEEGFRLDSHYAALLRSTTNELGQFPSSREVFLRSNGAPYVEGETLQQPDLARTYRAIARDGVAWFYDGPFARAVDKWMKQNRGIMTAADFKKYRAVLRPPISTDYRSYTIISFPPPSSGGVHLLEILNMLETRDMGSPAFGELDRTHFIAEAMKLAFADRAFWLGDPDFVKVPRGLISKGYARDLANKIKLAHVTDVSGHGQPEDANTNVFPEHTTHVSAADAEGNWVALTATINTHFGSKVVIPGTGVVMNNEMDDFSAQPGAANYFGLIGAEANAISPGKRPLSSMSPTLVLKNRQPILAVGAAGGPTIISQTVLNIIDMLDLGMDAQTAIAAPKFHHQWKPDELVMERPVKPEILAGLQERGHTVRLVNALGAAQAVSRLPDDKGFMGAADPRVGGQAAAW
ncbi:MAG TPA: gamma-glutamyltransferase [Candidatus Saccharimonadales bacterium]|nr:gamma-glutamyltransferase [Candidatus Saccharimonadales bacterium]